MTILSSSHTLYGSSSRPSSVEVTSYPISNPPGPEIELIPEKKAPIYKDVTCITNSDEPYLDDNLMVSFDLMKIYWTRDENYELIKAMYISNKVKARHLLNALAKTTMINPDKACVTAKGEKVDFELTSNILTLEDYKITENQVLNITQRSSNDVGHRSNDKGNNTGKDIGNPVDII